MDNKKCSKKKQKKNKILMQLNLKNDSGHESDNTSNSSPIPVDLMTSRELQYDLNARISTVRRILKDTVRIDNFKEAILHNKHLFKNKYVLNIGCGIGIYSLFAAKAGAAKVYAVDDSNVIYYTQQVVEANGYSEIIKVIKGKITEIELPVPVVDVIVSDWMGNALLYETSCQDVIFARDKWLKKSDGLIFPDEAKLFMVAFEDAIVKNRNIEWWRRVYGFDMSYIRDVALKEPRIHIIKPQQVLSKQFRIKTLNLYTATLEDLKIRTKFVLPIIKSGRMDGIGLYFHVCFTKSHIPFGFSTDPWSLATDWMQTKLFFDEFLIVRTGSIYYGGIEFHPAKSINDFRNMVINLEILKGDPAATEEEIQMTWHFKLHDDNMENEIKSSNKNNVGSKKMKPANIDNLNCLTINQTTNETDYNNHALKENCATNFSLLSLNCDNQTKYTDKSKMIKNCKKESIIITNPNISIQNKTNCCMSTVHLRSKQVKKEISDNFDTKEQNCKSNSSNHHMNATITIGEYNYPCRNLKRNKCKLSKRN